MLIIQCCAGGLWALALTKEFKRFGHKVIQGDINQQILHLDLWITNNPVEEPEKFAKQLQEYAVEKKVDMIYPHNHNEALAMSMCAPELCVLSSPVAILNTHNKAKLQENLEKAGLPQKSCWYRSKEQIFIDCEIKLPIRLKHALAKPIDSCGSQGIITNIADKYIVMERFEGTEYTCDVVADHGKIIDWCARERLRTSGGVCIDAMVHQRVEEIQPILEKFVRFFELTGPLAIQGFVEENGKWYITDCNHRFGGGVGLSIAAGWRGVEAYCALAQGKEFKADYEFETVRVRRKYVEEVIS